MKIYQKVRNGVRRDVYLFGFKVFSYKKQDAMTAAQLWRERNAHNETVCVNDFDIGKVSVGNGTYGGLLVATASDGDEQLTIGHYCSIGPEVHFILASEHPYRGISTYPFKVKLGLQKKEARSKGDIVLEDDVWIGHGAIIHSGVRIGKGAIVAAGSVVVKDVEPYSIVGGNPAKFIKYRFDEPIRKKLMQFDFSNINRQTFIDNIDLVYEPLSEENVDKVINGLTKHS